MTRRDLREKVFKILFRLEFNSDEDMKEQIELALNGEIPAEDEELFAQLEYSEENKKYISDRVLDIVDRHSEIDAVIEEISEGWKLARIGKAGACHTEACHNMMMKYDDDIPVKVATMRR